MCNLKITCVIYFAMGQIAHVIIISKQITHVDDISECCRNVDNISEMFVYIRVHFSNTQRNGEQHPSAILHDVISASQRLTSRANISKI